MFTIKQPISVTTRWLLGVMGIGLLIAFYSHLSRQQHQINPSDTTLPGLHQLIDGFKEICTPRSNNLKSIFSDATEAESIGIRDTWLYKDAAATYSRLFIGISLGCLISTLFGILMGCYEWLAAILLPPFAFLAKVPGTAMLAVFFVLAGTGETMFNVMICFGILPTLVQSIYLSVKHDIHEEEINKAFTLGASNFEVIWNVIFRKILPKILENIRLQIGPAMVYLIAAEMLVGQVGMGYQIRMQQRLLSMNIVYDYLLILGITGLIMDQGMLTLRRWICPWFSRYK